MTIKMNNTLLNRMVDEVVGGYLATSAILTLYTGGQPAGTTPTGTALVAITTDGGWAPAVDGVSTVIFATPTAATATGVAGWARIGGGTTTVDGSVGMAGSGADFIVNATTITAGLNVSIASLSIRLPTN